MKNKPFRLYRWLDRLPGARANLDRKLAVVLVAAACLPTLAYVAVRLAMGLPLDSELLWTIGGLGLVAALAGFLGVRAVLAPLDRVAGALRRHLAPDPAAALPIEFHDTLGQIMRDAEHLAQRAERAAQHIQRQAEVDELTGFYTRNAAKRRLAEDCARVDRGLMTLHLAVLTLDNLHAAAAVHGTAVAETMLQHAAQVVEGNVRKADWTALWNHDVFVIGFCDNTWIDDAVKRMISLLRTSPMKLPGGASVELVPVCGVAEYLPGSGPKAAARSAVYALSAARARLAEPNAPGYVISNVVPDSAPEADELF